MRLRWPEAGGTGRITRVSSYTNFFLGSTTVSGALTGLLFVSLSVAPQRLLDLLVSGVERTAAGGSPEGEHGESGR